MGSPSSSDSDEQPNKARVAESQAAEPLRRMGVTPAKRSARWLSSQPSRRQRRFLGGHCRVVARSVDPREKGPHMVESLKLRSLVDARYWLLPALLCVACAGRGAPLATAPGSSTGPDGAQADSSAPADGSGRGSSATNAGPGSARPAAPLPGGEEPTPDKALPELRVEPLGMHVGGGKNDAEEKAPFHRALERKFPAFLECYRLAEDPWSGGSFGIDIKIARAGGKPVVEQPRTKIRGSGFQDCMLAAFGNADFDKPKAGPTVISYSVRFTLVGTKPKR